MSATAICPVCGHEVDADDPVGGSYEYRGVTYRFCTEREREAFAANPEGILEKSARPRGLPRPPSLRAW